MSTSPDYQRYKMYKYIAYGAGAIVFALTAGLLFGFVIMFLWNATIADMFGLTAISFWQAFGLFILAKLFFGFGSTGMKSKGYRGRYDGKFRWAKFKDRSADHQSFREFWESEGKQAYEVYRGAQEVDKEDNSE